MKAFPPKNLRPCQLDLVIKPTVVAWRLSCVVIAIVTIGAAANYIIYQVVQDPAHKLTKLLLRFDLGHEPSIPALYSTLALSTCAVLLAVIAIATRHSGAPYFRHWLGLAIVFAILAIDENVQIHEMVDTGLHEAFSTRGALFFPWIIPGAAFAGAMGLVYLKFLWHLDARSRWIFIGAGSLFVFGAVGMEMVAGIIADSSLGLESIAHTISQTIEELCEMLGVVIFMYGLLDYIGRNITVIRLSFCPPVNGG